MNMKGGAKMKYISKEKIFNIVCCIKIAVSYTHLTFDVAIRLGKVAVTGTVIDPFRGTITNPMLPLPGRGNKRSTVTGKSQGIRINKPFRNRLL